MMDDYGLHRAGSSSNVWGIIFMFLMMVLVVVGIVAIVHYMNHGTGRQQSEGTALDLLEKRYAKGEIDKKEFEEKRTVLGS